MSKQSTPPTPAATTCLASSERRQRYHGSDLGDLNRVSATERPARATLGAAGEGARSAAHCGLDGGQPDSVVSGDNMRQYVACPIAVEGATVTVATRDPTNGAPRRPPPDDRDGGALLRGAD